MMFIITVALALYAPLVKAAGKSMARTKILLNHASGKGLYGWSAYQGKGFEQGIYIMHPTKSRPGIFKGLVLRNGDTFAITEKDKQFYLDLSSPILLEAGDFEQFLALKPFKGRFRSHAAQAKMPRMKAEGNSTCWDAKFKVQEAAVKNVIGADTMDWLNVNLSIMTKSGAKFISFSRTRRFRFEHHKIKYYTNVELKHKRKLMGTINRTDISKLKVKRDDKKDKNIKITFTTPNRDNQGNITAGSRDWVFTLVDAKVSVNDVKAYLDLYVKKIPMKPYSLLSQQLAELSSESSSQSQDFE